MSSAIPFRWTQIPVVDCDVIVRPNGEKLILEDEVGTAEAARIIGCAPRTVQAMCDEGVLLEGIEWRRIPGRRSREGKVYRIKRSAALSFRSGRS